MKEFNMLVKAYAAFKNGTQIPLSFFFDDIPDEGSALEFVEWLKKEEIEDQAHFLSHLFANRPLILDRLIEISNSTDSLHAALIASAALISSDYYKPAVDRLVSEAQSRIIFNADSGFPVGWIIDALYDDALLRGTSRLEELRSLAEMHSRTEVADEIRRTIENVDSQQIEQK